MTKQIRRYAFHHYDRRHAYSDSVAWASDRYLLFRGLRAALIDVQSFKMSYPTAKKSGFTSVEFSSDFKMALGTKEDGCYLGRVELPETAVALASPN